YDEEGFVRELRYLASDGRPRPDRNGIFGHRHEHDARGFVSAIQFLGHGDQPVMHPDGYARETRVHDERGNRTETAYLGLDSQPVLGPGGLARKLVKHDADGNITEIHALGLDNGPVRRREGYSTERRVYDKEGRLASAEYLDTEGKRTRDWLRVSRIEYGYSDGGKRREERFLDEVGNPARHRALACTRLVRVFDDEGHEAEAIAPDLDLSGMRELRFALPAPRVRRKFDERGNVVEESYHDAEGAPARSWFGVHRTVTKHDERGHRLEVRFEDDKGKPARPVSALSAEPFVGKGPAALRWAWDDAGNNLEAVALGLDGNPTEDWTLPVQLATGPREGENGMPPGVARVACKYDDRGNRVEIDHQGADGETMAPAASRQGPVRGRLVLEYDAQGSIASASLLGKNGKLAAGLGPTRITVQHDDDGRLLELALFGPAGRVAGTGGISKYRFGYDKQGNRTSEAYFGTDGEALSGPAGFAKATYEYDAGGNLTESRYFDPAGERVPTRVMVVGKGATPGPGPAVEVPKVPLEKGDIVLRYGGQAIASTAQLHDIKRREDPGRASREAVILRGDKEAAVMLPAGFPGGDRFADLVRRAGRGQGGNPLWLLRALPAQGLTPPLMIGDAELRTVIAVDQ
ncbi:MAG: hypothetical protein K2W96_19135, partial [Gemmataceae bacterium]|nr:hypothetical protein [Gemmataceae bacterium]